MLNWQSLTNWRGVMLLEPELIGYQLPNYTCLRTSVDCGALSTRNYPLRYLFIAEICCQRSAIQFLDGGRYTLYFSWLKKLSTYNFDFWLYHFPNRLDLHTSCLDARTWDWEHGLLCHNLDLGNKPPKVGENFAIAKTLHLFIKQT